MYILSQDALDNQTAAALECATEQAWCTAICANPDLAGIGVRVAFYAQSVMNTLLVVLSPRDSVPSAWAGTLLTASLIIAAIVQKIRHSLTLHHATLILNFATLSCISSLAAAPMLPIWRLRPSEYYAQELTRHALMNEHDGEDQNILESEVYINRHKKKIKAAQSRERLVLALALLTQVVLQWAWGIIMFVSPSYSQQYCSGDTLLLFFLIPFRGRQIAIQNGWIFAVWPLWLLFSLGVTLALTIILALSSPNRAHDYVLSRNTMTSISVGSSSTPVLQGLLRLTYGILPAWNDRPKQLIFWGNLVACLLWLFFLVSSEWQRSMNHIFEGEQDFGGFGQVTALLLSLAPLWSLTVAVYKYPSLRRRQERLQIHAEQRERSRERGTSQSPPLFDPDEARDLLQSDSPPTHGSQSFAHSRGGSGKTLVGEEHEMSKLTPTYSSPSLGRGRTERLKNASETSQASSSGLGGAKATSSGREASTVHVVTIPSPHIGLDNFMDEGYFPRNS